MRIRSLVSLALGVALGATGARLLDPVSGRERRRTFLRTSLRRIARTGSVLRRTSVAVRELTEALADGYRRATRPDDDNVRRAA